MVLEMDVADVLGVVVARDDHGEQFVDQGSQRVAGHLELVGVPLLGEIAGDHHHVWLKGEDLLDGVTEQVRVEILGAAVDVRQLGDGEHVGGRS